RVVRSRDPDPGFERIAAAAVFLGQRAAALGGDRHPGGAPVARPHLDAAARIGLRRLQDQSAIGAGPGAAGGMGGGAAGAAPAEAGTGVDRGPGPIAPGRMLAPWLWPATRRPLPWRAVHSAAPLPPGFQRPTRQASRPAAGPAHAPAASTSTSPSIPVRRCIASSLWMRRPPRRLVPPWQTAAGPGHRTVARVRRALSA